MILITRLKCLIIILGITLPFCSSKAQTNTLYTYQQLSKDFYAKQKDSLKKAWTCPGIYSNRATQKSIRKYGMQELLSLTVQGIKYLIINNLKKSRHTTEVCNLLIIKYIEGGPLRA